MDIGSAARSTGAEWIGQPIHEALRRSVRPQLPADDPFYLPPQGFEHAMPGTVLRSRDVELAFLGLVPQKLTATQLLYRSTDLNGLPQATVTTVVVPTERDAGSATPIV
jgi:triacylglycerol lipase